MPEERDTLLEMREQVDAAYASAERLVREAEAAARERTRDVPPRGYAEPGHGAEPDAAAGRGGTALEALQAILGLLEVARAQVPPELAQQFAGALRELLVAVRALIDWYLERLDAPAPDEPASVDRASVDRASATRVVEEIPID